MFFVVVEMKTTTIQCSKQTASKRSHRGLNYYHCNTVNKHVCLGNEKKGIDFYRADVTKKKERFVTIFWYNVHVCSTNLSWK